MINKKTIYQDLTVALFFAGNPLTCDCRLSWIYTLRNETRDILFKQALEKISCITEPVERQLNDQEDNENFNGNAVVDDTYEYYDKNEDYETKILSKATKLTDIPLETLPCPKELIQTEEYGHPVQNEIRLKAFSNVEKISPCLILIVFGMLLC